MLDSVSCILGRCLNTTTVYGLRGTIRRIKLLGALSSLRTDLVVFFFFCFLCSTLLDYRTMKTYLTVLYLVILDTKSS